MPVAMSGRFFPRYEPIDEPQCWIDLATKIAVMATCKMAAAADK